MHNLTAAILAGGQSSRMGFNKAFIEIEARPIIERSVKLLKGLFRDVIVIANDVPAYERLDVRVASDLIKGAGSLGGIYTAIFHSGSNHTFVTACDMPYLNADVIGKIISSAGGYDAVVPFIGSELHPMHAIYSKRCLKPIRSMIDEGNFRIKDLFNRIDVRRLVVEDFKGLPAALSVTNVNTREDLSRILKDR
ncbi:MAG: molybdenum cofactor guanylyltransferase [Deltaproteobacteria bacterium]|nr:molybdenum cofactor guanylyltransferase [Deltaproteobacteria bacterium]